MRRPLRMAAQVAVVPLSIVLFVMVMQFRVAAGFRAVISRWWDANFTHGLLAGPLRNVTLAGLVAAVLLAVLVRVWLMVRVKGSRTY